MSTDDHSPSLLADVSIRQAALDYVSHGFQPIPIQNRSKAPVNKAWNEPRIPEAEIDRYFKDDGNIGLLLGEEDFGSLVDVDLDVSEAIKAAPHFLPETSTIHGHASKPDSHYWYACDAIPKTKKYHDPDGTCLLELRATGHQTVVPPSIHPSGELITWHRRGELSKISGNFVLRGCNLTAACTILARRWPKEGSRHEFCLALSGTLGRAGWPAAQIGKFISITATVAGDDEAEDRKAIAEDTARRLSSGQRAYGPAKLTEFLGKNVIRKLLAWLEIDHQQPPSIDTREQPSKDQKRHIDDLIELSSDVTLFHTPEGEAYAIIPHGEHVENVRVNSEAFRQWLRYRFFTANEKAPGTQSLADAVATLEAKAQFEGESHEVHLRVAEHDGSLFLDLGNQEMQVVQLTSLGWSLVDDPPIFFRRTKNMRLIPVPTRGGSLDELTNFLNLADTESYHLIIAWLTYALRPSGPYPILIIQGEQGSAKSTTARLLRNLIDPSRAPLRSLFATEQDLMISARHSHVLAYDNLSGLQAWRSDAFCRLSTGGAYAARTLFSNDEETVLESCSPVILNGIDDLATRSDLASRSISLTLPPIPDGQRKTEKAFWEDFEEAHPKILGALLTAACGALRSVANIQIAHDVRMADFAQWGSALETVLGWPKHAFINAYARNTLEALEAGVDADIVAVALRSFADEQHVWEGTATELLAKLTTRAYKNLPPPRNWPKTPSRLGGQLRRAAPQLRTVGIEVETYKSGKRLIRIENVSEMASVPSVPSRSLQVEAGVQHTTDSLDGADGTDGNE